MLPVGRACGGNASNITPNKSMCSHCINARPSVMSAADKTASGMPTLTDSGELACHALPLTMASAAPARYSTANTASPLKRIWPLNPCITGTHARAKAATAGAGTGSGPCRRCSPSQNKRGNRPTAASHSLSNDCQGAPLSGAAHASTEMPAPSSSQMLTSPSCRRVKLGLPRNGHPKGSGPTAAGPLSFKRPWGVGPITCSLTAGTSRRPGSHQPGRSS